ncbi:hypothetical protein [uncultured Clostridium sp.]|uniref:hypothetical protein n=1 Tax=uncultured Clostridium sp. TaxID=59620 RepID=UPI0028EECAD2|nr:hypothetical protein [uncultured Clostridium sp.]
MSNEKEYWGYHGDNDLKTCGCSCHEKEAPLIHEDKTEKVNDTSGKSATNNNWTSVPQNYDIEEASRRHKKTATNNQW